MFSMKTHTEKNNASLFAFPAGAFVVQVNTPCKISYASLIKFLAGAFVFQETHPGNELCVSDHVPSRGFCFQENTTAKLGDLG